MRKNYVKITCILIVVLFFSSPVIASISNKTNSYQEEPTALTELITQEPDPKIVELIEMINESYVREILTVLCLEIGPRKTQTQGAEKAAKYIFDEFEDMGLETKYHYWQDFNDRRKFRYYKDKNVEGTLNGIDESDDDILVFNAHYDSVIVNQGAIDDGSGTAAVIAAARALSNFEFNRTIKFVTFSGEEVGLIGSRLYARELYKADTDILVEINADMVGYATTPEENKTAYVSKSADAGWVIDEIMKVNEIYDIGFDIANVWNLTADGDRHGSDFWDFVYHGYEAVAFWESGGYEYAHTPYDTFDQVNFPYLTNMTKLMAATLAHLADIEAYHPYVQVGAPKRGRLYHEDRTLKVFKHEQTIVLDDFLVCADVKPGDAPIEKVEFYYDGKLMFTDEEAPYNWRLNKISFIRKHTVEVKLYDEKGREASDKITFRFINLLKDK